ncbi:MoaD/ThiS family protein, partial [candidate division CSSED10-310 bacterium]
MMKIKVSFARILKIEGVENGSSVELEEGMSIKEFLSQHKMPREHQQFLVPIVNKKTTKLSYILQDLDELELYLPVGGG